MTDATAYTPPKVRAWNKDNVGTFTSNNRPITSSPPAQVLPDGSHPLDRQSFVTVNTDSTTVLLEAPQTV